MNRNIGFLTDTQLKTLILRQRGYSYGEIGSRLGVSRQSVAATLKKALKNISKARETLIVYRIVSSDLRILVKPGIKLVGVPKLVLEEADKHGVRVRADFTLIYKMIRFRTRECIRGDRVVEPILILLDRSGDVEVYSFREVEKYYTYIEKMVKDLELPL